MSPCHNPCPAFSLSLCLPFNKLPLVKELYLPSFPNIHKACDWFTSDMSNHLSRPPAWYYYNGPAFKSCFQNMDVLSLCPGSLHAGLALVYFPGLPNWHDLKLTPGNVLRNKGGRYNTDITHWVPVSVGGRQLILIQANQVDITSLRLWVFNIQSTRVGVGGLWCTLPPWCSGSGIEPFLTRMQIWEDLCAC